MATASQLIAQARRLAENEMVELLSDEQALALLNEVYTELWGTHPWPFAQTTQVLTVPAGATSVPVPGASGVVWVRGADGSPLEQRGPWPQDWTNMSAPAQPRDFFVDWQYPVGGNEPQPVIQLFMQPGPSVQLAVRVPQAVEPLGTDDTPRIPLAFHTILAYEMAARLLEQEADDSGRVATLRNQALATLEQMRVSIFGTFTSFTLGERVRGQRRRVGRR